MADVAKISERTNPKYDDNIDKWQMYSDATRGGKDFVTDTYLFSHRLEDSDDFEERLERGYYLNYCDIILETFNNYIFKESIERPPDTGLEKFRGNVDGKNTSITDFVKRVGYLTSEFGTMHTFVDIPVVGNKNPSIADEKVITPYCSLIYPHQLRDWSLDPLGNFNWVIIESTYYDDTDPLLEREEIKHYKVITRDRWWVEDEDGEKVTFPDGTPSSGDNKLGIIPIVTQYHKDIDDDKVGESLIKDIAMINRTVMNWCSLVDEQVERQTFSQLIMPDDPSMEESDQKGEDPLSRVGSSSIFTFNPDATHPPGFISPNTETVNTIWKLILDHVKEMFRLAGLQGGTSDLYTSRSGRQSQMSFLGVNSALASKSSKYQKFENDVNKMVYRQMGWDISSIEDVKYPDKFDIVGLYEEIDGIFTLLERNFSETLNKTLMKDVARKATPLITETQRTIIENEIDAGDGVVEPINSMGIQPEKEGDGNINSDLGKSFKSKDQKEKEDSSHRRKEK